MFHPLIDDLSHLKDSELESKISELTKKYFKSTNPHVRHEIALYLDSYNDELNTRRQKAWKEAYDKRDTDLDNLINVD